MMLDCILMFGSAVAGWVCVELVKMLAGARKSGLTETESFMMKEMYDMHNVRDENGRPLWYMPPKMDDNMHRTVLVLRDIVRLQAEHARLLEKLHDEIRKT